MLLRTFSFFTVIMSLFLSAATAQSIIVKGAVKDTKGSPVPFASIQVRQSTSGTKADSLGGFRLDVDAKASFVVSAVGFADTTISVNNRSYITVILHAGHNTLEYAMVTSTDRASALPPPDEAAKEEIIAGTLENYARGAMISNGIYVTNSYNPAAKGAAAFNHQIITGFGPLNTLNSGEMLPEITHKEVTRGSRYLLTQPAPGIIVDEHDNILTDSSKRLNYDKIDGKLLIALAGDAGFLEIDKDKVNGFAFKAQDTTYVFMKMPVIDVDRYFILVANGSSYSVYKMLKTKFVRSDYHTNGLVETGNNYDEYVDEQAYFLVERKLNTYKRFELKKKSIKDAFVIEKSKVDLFFDQHHKDALTEQLIKKLTDFCNMN